MDRAPGDVGLSGRPNRSLRNWAGRAHGPQIRTVVRRHRGRHGDHVDLLVRQTGRVGREGGRNRAQDMVLDLAGAVVALPDLLDPILVDVKTNDAVAPRQGDRQW